MMLDRPDEPIAPGAEEGLEPALNGEAVPEEAAEPAPTAPGIRAGDIAWRIEVLADDRFEGRAPATEAGEAAADWIAEEMARIGLEPAGDGGSWFQRVQLVQATLDPEQSHFDFAVNGEGMNLQYGPEVMFWTTRVEEELEIDASEVVFVGYGVVAPEYGWNDYEGLDVAGKTVIILVNDPGFATGDPELFNGRAMTYYGRWTYKYEEAARQGAAAAIIVHETEPASYGWGVVESSWSGTQYDLQRPDGAQERIIAEGWITRDVADNLFEAAGLDYETLRDAASQRGFEWVTLEGVTASARLSTGFNFLESRNVAGILRGAERPDEVFIYTAHWDHLGTRVNEAGEVEIYNGAIDNASGTAMILEIAEHMAAQQRRPDRSVLFLAVTLEESGLLGSAYYGESPLFPLADTVGGINIDAMLPVGRTRDVVVIGYGASELEDILAEEAAAQGRHLAPDPSPEAGYFYRSDHISLARHGVPMLYPKNGIDHVEHGEARGREISEWYRTVAYHQPTDEFSPDWDFSGMEEDAELAFRTGWRIVNSNDWPNWYEGNEFRALRDAQRAGR
ncbi:MAG: M28 family peptidase [Maricaulaceae bacterium]|nr:M28 family peptidase [Maricaulaceae bacterium]